jgi:seryl-tRNA synthetase
VSYKEKLTLSVPNSFADSGFIGSKGSLMKSPTFEEITEKSLPVKSDVDSEVRDSVERENSKTVQSAHTKVGLDAERLRSSIAKLTSSSTNELDKLITELEALMQRMNRTDDELWRAIAENTNSMSRLVHQQLEIGSNDPNNEYLMRFLLKRADNVQRQYQDCTAELRRRYP